METQRKIAIVDIETTGPNYVDGDRIIQIAAIIIENGKITANHSMILNPEQTIPNHIIHLTGIQQEKANLAPTFEQVATLWNQRLKDCIFVAHNLAFDLNFLVKSFHSVGIEFNPLEKLDTVLLSKILLPTAQGYNLTDLAKHFDLTFNDAHDALADAITTTRILHLFSEYYRSLSIETKRTLTELSDHLQNSEALFFLDSEVFELDELIRFASPLALKKNGMINQEKGVSHWIFEQLQTNHHLMIGNRNNLVTDETFYGLLEQTSETVVIVHTKAREFAKMDKAIYIQNKREFVSVPSIEWLCQNFINLHLNQTELIQLMATIVWLQETNEGVLSELNYETTPLSIVEKYVPKNIAKNKEKFYRKYLRQLRKAQYFMVEPNEVYKLADFDTRNLQISLYIENLETLYYELFDYQTKSLAFSQSFTQLQSYYDSKIQEESSKQDLIDNLRQLLRMWSTLIENMVLIFKTEFTTFSKTQEQKMILLHSEQRDNIQKSLVKIKNKVKYLVNLIKQDEKESDTFIQQLKNKLELLLEGMRIQENIVIKATHFNHNFFQFIIESNALQLEIETLNWMMKYSKVLIIDNGLFNESIEWQGTKHNFKQFKYLQLPGLYTEKKVIYLPFGHLISEKFFTEIQINEELSYYQEKAVKAQIDFIKDLNEFKKIVIIAPNKNAIELSYRLLNEHGINQKCTIHADGITGNLKRVLRKIQEQETGICIINRFNLLANPSLALEDEMQIMIQTLPFTSPSLQESQLILRQYDFDELKLFDRYLLGKMKRDFRKLLVHIYKVCHPSSVYLFDERVYTKYYSSSVRKYLEDWIIFEIID